MTDRGFRAFMSAESGGAEWYFIGAVFVFAGAGTAFSQRGWFLGMLVFVAGIVLVAAGAYVWQRAAKRSLQKRADEAVANAGDADDQPIEPPKI